MTAVAAGFAARRRQRTSKRRVNRSAGLQWIALALAAVASVAAASPAGAEGTGLDGSWTATAARRQGVPAPDLVGHRLTLAAGRFRIEHDGRMLFGGSYVVDPSGKIPRITLHQEAGATLRGTWLGIWRLDGERLTICDNAGDMTKPAPADFAACEGAGYVVLEFRR